MYRLVPALVGQMGQAYPELNRAEGLIAETLKSEEDRFKTTLDRGLRLLEDELQALPENAPLPGDVAFKLYDTYGFPFDMTQDAMREKNRIVDAQGFDAAMAEQKAKARAAWAGSGEAADAKIWFDIADQHGVTEFLGYDTDQAEGKILALVQDGQSVASVGQAQSVVVIVNQTPFYAESGGQVGDTGVIATETGTAQITDTKKVAGLFLHFATVTSGEIAVDIPATLTIDAARRAMIRANHSATHLLHESLRHTLGDHVVQRGSLNAAERLRFDFAHSKAVSLDELRKISNDVNAYIRQNTPVQTRIMTPDSARDLGAQALFGEKYGDEVRVVSMGHLPGSGKGTDQHTYSIELCGGTHVARTGDIGLFVILGDSASSAGVRRIEALTGQTAFDYLAGQAGTLMQVAAQLNATPDTVLDRVHILKEDRKAFETQVAQLRRDLAMAGGDTAPQSAEHINGVPFLAQVLTGVTGKDLAGLIDDYKSNLGSAAVLLIADTGGKVAVAAGVTDDLIDQISAVDLVKAAVAELGGKGGGGRADFAQGGGKDATASDQAIAAAKAILEGR